MTIRKRLAVLEARQPKNQGRWHRVIHEVGQTQDEAIDIYGRSQIAADDNIIFLKIVDPPARHREEE